jgi:hypothetical protein
MYERRWAKTNRYNNVDKIPRSATQKINSAVRAFPNPKSSKKSMNEWPILQNLVKFVNF